MAPEIERSARGAEPPFATASPIQRAIEEHALRIWEAPLLRDARQRAVRAFEIQPQAAAGRDTLERAADEMLFNHCMRTVNGDAHRPRIMAAGFPPHHWGKRSVPGGRFCGNNPDTCYRYVPIDGGSAYEIEGRLSEPCPTDFSIMLPAIDPETGAFRVLGVWTGNELVTDEAGRFRVTIDPEPAAGRPNHIQSAPDAQGLQIRDTLLDWAAETPHPLAVRHLGTPRDPARTDTELCTLFARDVDRYFAGWLSWMRSYCYANEVNSLPAPSRVPRGLATQIGASGHFSLHEDEALVVSLSPMGARYVSLQVSDPWCVCADYDMRFRSLNQYQAGLGDDGRLTFVISATDPGVRNWIETHGIPCGTLFVRWQGLPADRVVPPDALTCRTNSIDALPRFLASGSDRITASEREAQRVERKRAIARRHAPSISNPAPTSEGEPDSTDVNSPARPSER